MSTLACILQFLIDEMQNSLRIFGFNPNCLLIRISNECGISLKILLLLSLLRLFFASRQSYANKLIEIQDINLFQMNPLNPIHLFAITYMTKVPSTMQDLFFQFSLFHEIVHKVYKSIYNIAILKNCNFLQKKN